MYAFVICQHRTVPHVIKKNIMSFHRNRSEAGKNSANPIL